MKIKICAECGYRSEKESDFVEINEEGGWYRLCVPCLEGIEDVIDELVSVHSKYSSYIISPSAIQPKGANK